MFLSRRCAVSRFRDLVHRLVIATSLSGHFDFIEEVRQPVRLAVPSLRCLPCQRCVFRSISIPLLPRCRRACRRTRVQVSAVPDEVLTVLNYKEMALELIVRASDVSNCAKPFGVSKQWFNRLTAEFFQQGDREKELGLPVSWFMDRTSPCVAECQVGLIVRRNPRAPMPTGARRR